MVETATQIEAPYNYEHFGQRDFAEVDTFKEMNPVGTIAPDFPVVRLRDLAGVALSDYLGKGFVVLEFGSVT